VPDWSKYARLSSDERAMLEKASARARAAREAQPTPRAKQEFARVTYDMLPRLIGLGGPAVCLFLIMVMYSGRLRTRRAGGWFALPGTATSHIGLADRRVRSDVVRQLVTHGILETRQPTPGSSLEYRLRQSSSFDPTTH
jgi:hypothetical protein